MPPKITKCTLIIVAREDYHAVKLYLLSWGSQVVLNANKKCATRSCAPKNANSLLRRKFLVIQANAKIEPALLPKVKTHARLNGHINLRRKFTLSWLKRNIKEKPS